jgi:multiple sugar transport system permease protein
MKNAAALHGRNGGIMGSGVSSIPARRFSQRRVVRRTVTGYAYLLPSLLFLASFTIYPVFQSLFLSLSHWELLRPPTFVGAWNYTRLVADERFWKSLGNTLYYVAAVVPLNIVVGIVLAVALNQSIRGVRAFRALYYLPVVSTWVAVAVVWRWMYNYEFGIINYALGLVGVPAFDWLGDLNLAMPSVIAVSVWKSAGYNMTILLAGLQGISQVYYEAAEIDGASAWQRFWSITLPLLTPSIFFIAVMGAISSFQVFGPIYVMTDGGPLGATDVLIFYLYENAYRYFKMGYASAIAWVLFAFIFMLTALQSALSKRWVHYE